MVPVLSWFCGGLVLVDFTQNLHGYFTSNYASITIKAILANMLEIMDVKENKWLLYYIPNFITGHNGGFIADDNSIDIMIW